MDEHLDWLCERNPDSPGVPRSGCPPADRRQVIQGVFWILDNGASWSSTGQLSDAQGMQQTRLNTLVPEPTTLSLLAMSVLMVGRRQR